MRLKTPLLRHVVYLTLMCCCQSYRLQRINDFDFSKLPEVCEPESCSDANDRDGSVSQNCDCSETCSKYGTCCFDSTHILSPVRVWGKREECSKVWQSDFAAFVVSNCNPRWRGQHLIRTLCEGIIHGHRDPLAGIPVTNPFSKITYKNFFCSLCNFDHRGGVLWNVLLTFPHNRKFGTTQDEREDVLRRLEYSRNDSTWGIWNKSNDDNTMEFVPLKISSEIPPAVKSIVKVCDVNLESRCARTWDDESVKKMCKSYIFPITIPVGEGNERQPVKFRNPHCAICNYVIDFEEADCFETPRAPSLSFTILLDVNPSDGDQVGMTESCGQNEVHDPFFKKCRALVCALPGQTVKNGRCTST